MDGHHFLSDAVSTCFSCSFCAHSLRPAQPQAQRRALECLQVPGGQPAHSWVTSGLLDPPPYRAMQGILEILEYQAPRGSQDYQESLGFGAPWGQKVKRSVRQGAICYMNKKKSG